MVLAEIPDIKDEQISQVTAVIPFSPLHFYREHISDIWPPGESIIEEGIDGMSGNSVSVIGVLSHT